MNFVTLYRPVGRKELTLIEQSNNKKFPARLKNQPYFYPVLNKAYAIEIARDWNTKDPESEYRGYVTEFKVKSEYINKFEIHKVGGKNHLEYWIPEEELNEFNNNIVGVIKIIAQFRREK